MSRRQANPPGQGQEGQPRVHPVTPDWREVAPGHDVSLYKKGQGPFHGRVDDVTPDGAILWVHLAEGRGRRMFAQEEGCHLTVNWTGAAPSEESRAS
jgi:hypothetical protein